MLQAVGLSWAAIMPPRTWPVSPEERRKARRAIRECGWSAALQTLALESRVVLIAARQLARWEPLNEEDDQRLGQAVERIAGAATTLTEASQWRPEVRQ